MTEADITLLLAERHSKDVFVPQCKNGPTQCAHGLLKLDAWAMARSWAHPKLTAYEIKVSRQDFLKDDKWRMALDWCNEFYWVAPEAIIDKAEIAAECGLLTVSRNGSRLFTRKRAPYREIDEPGDLFRYILMCRTSIKGEDEERSNSETWRRWMERRDADKQLGWNVSKKIQEVVAQRIDDVANENHTLRSSIKAFDEIVPMLEKYKFGSWMDSPRGRYWKPDSRWWIERTLCDANEIIDNGVIADLRRIADSLLAIKEKYRPEEYKLEGIAE